jgi:hypothetical protein
MDEPLKLPAGTPGHESTDVDPKRVAVVGIGILVGLGAVALAGSYFLYRGLEGREPIAGPSRISESPEPAPAPRLQAYPILDLERVRAAEDAAIAGYGWVDRRAGIARIPVERAIDLLAAHPLQAARPAAAPPRAAEKERRR